MNNINMGWNFDNSYIHLPEKLYSMQNPTPVPSPEMVILNEPLSASLGLDINGLQISGVEIFAGNEIPEGAAPIAQAYAGHQFGHFTMLGDGRALLLGEQITPDGRRFDIQLKGSGRTPYSRGGDGRAAIGPMLREYIISEALNNLNIPTTRSLAVVTTGKSSIDTRGRYAYGNQPQIAAWNLARFAETLLPLLHDDEDEALQMANEEISDFSKIYFKFWLNGMRAKLGLFSEEAEDESIITELLSIMEKHEADYTNTFRNLTISKFDGMDLFCSDEFAVWKEKWEKRLAKENSIDDSEKLMRENNPAIIPRNHKVEEALKAAEKEGDLSVMEKLLNALSNPYAYSAEQDEYSTLPPPSKRPYRTFCGT